MTGIYIKYYIPCEPGGPHPQFALFTWTSTGRRTQWLLRRGSCTERRFCVRYVLVCPSFPYNAIPFLEHGVLILCQVSILVAQAFRRIQCLFWNTERRFCVSTYLYFLSSFPYNSVLFLELRGLSVYVLLNVDGDGCISVSYTHLRAHETA